MNFLTILTLAAGLSMDAFAVAICKGLAMKEITWKKAAIVGLWFGGFQAMMPMAGYLLGVQFKESITSIDHWIAFVLLGLIGINMIKEACSKEEDVQDGSLGLKEMLDRCFGGRDYFRFFVGGYLGGGGFYWCGNLCFFHSRGESGKCFRNEI